jgi:putative N6-adenine-specific DNA methylase
MAGWTYFATTSKGLEGVLAEEITALGGKRATVTLGGVSFSGSRDLCYRANLWLRTANRVLLQLSTFPAQTPGELYEGVKAVPWPDLFSVRRTIAVDATVRDSRLTHSHYAGQKAKDAVVDRFRETLGARPDVDPAAPDVRIHLRIVQDACTLSLDTSGESLNRRGYRSDPAEASIRETLAAGIALLSGWDGR